MTTVCLQSIWALEHYPTPQTRLALTDTIENEHCFYKVRMDACSCLAKVGSSCNISLCELLNRTAVIAYFRNDGCIVLMNTEMHIEAVQT